MLWRSANAVEVLSALREQIDEIRERISVQPAIISFPTDGRGVRLKVAVRPEDATRVPQRIEIRRGDFMLVIPVEVTRDFEQPTPYVTPSFKAV